MYIAVHTRPSMYTCTCLQGFVRQKCKHLCMKFIPKQFRPIFHLQLTVCSGCITYISQNRQFPHFYVHQIICVDPKMYRNSNFAHENTKKASKVGYLTSGTNTYLIVYIDKYPHLQNNFSFQCFLLAIHRKQFHITLFIFNYFHSTPEVFAGLMLSPVLWHIHSMQRSVSVCRRNHLRFEFQLSHSNLSTSMP